MEKGGYSPIVLNLELERGEYSTQDKAFITALFYGIIERLLTLDYIIDKLVGDKKPEPIIRNLLRMGLYQIEFMESVPDSAAVNETVNLTPNRAKGYVNGVLRNFARARIRTGSGGSATTKLDEVEATNRNFTRNRGDFFNGELENNLSIKYSCPEWLVQKWHNEYGEANLLQILQTSLEKPPIFRHYVKKELSDSYVQDQSSYQACELLNPQSGEVVLDLCSAPGGKSFTIAKLMNNSGRVISCDINAKKLRLVESGSKRLGLDIIETLLNDAKVFNPDFPKCDKVVCDVPCSGLGVIRRKPEIKYKPASDFDGLPTIQLKILQTSASYVKSDGFLMYSTCTLSRSENDDVIESFLSEPSIKQQFELVQKKTTIPSTDGGDGFFVAILKRK